MRNWLKWFLFFSLIAAIVLLLIPEGSFQARGVDQAAWCERNVNQIRIAINQWAKDKNLPPGSAVTTSDILPYLKNGMPQCPVDGVYHVTAVGEAPTCSLPKERHRVVH
jgi:hypothetical protein